MKPFLKKYKIVIAVAVFILAIGAVFYFAVKPLFGAISSKNTKIQETLASQESKKGRLEELPGLREQFRMVENEEGKMIDLFGEDRAVELIEKVERIADATGNKIAIEVPGEKDKTGRPKTDISKEESELRAKLPGKDYLEITIKLEGNYNQLLNFLEKTEEAELYSDIISLDISVKQEKPGSSSDLGAASPVSGSETNQEKTGAEEIMLNSAVGVVFYVKK